MRPLSISCLFVAGLVMPTLVPTLVHARPLAGGSSPEISAIRICAALVLCLAAAFAAAIMLRRFGLPQGWRGLLAGPSRRGRHIQVIETRRVATHAELSLVRCGEAEFLILSGQADAKVISRREIDAPQIFGPFRP